MWHTKGGEGVWHNIYSWRGCGKGGEGCGILRVVRGCGVTSTHGGRVVRGCGILYTHGGGVARVVEGGVA